ncbi:MAG: Xaa-Pro dipeptidyl-peptidase [Gemmatimonadales bacterium]|nr:MAG: Xaa-Pro dipeptidyl-peptidase [Gemmatimonadales bacterium]
MRILVLALLLAPAAVTAQQSPTHVIEDGQAQVVEAFADSTTWVRQQLWVETSFDSDGDGRPDRMHVTVVRPATTDRVPVIYETSPYFGGSASVSDILWNVEHEIGEEPPPRGDQPYVEHRPERERISNSQVNTWVPRGFAVVHSESPGTGLSEGCPTMGGENESLAPKAVVDWLNGRARAFTSRDGDEEVTAEWATGRVGMTGTSFNGTLPLAAATTGVEGLEAIIPIAPNTSYWHYYRSHGLVRSPGGYLGEDIDGLYDYVFSGYPEVRDYCNSTVRAEMLEEMDRLSGNWSEFWASRDYALQTDSLRAAVLMAHAWNDWNVMPEHSVRVIDALRERDVPLQMYFHQGGHGGAPPLEMMNRWFTRYLLEVENGVEEDARAWIVREEDPRDEPTPYADYPHPDAEMVSWFPSGMRGLSMEPSPSGARQTVIDNVELSGAELAQLEDSEHRLLFATEELTEPVHISGTVELRVRMTADRPRANLSVWLVALPWTEAEARRPNFSVITRGWADPTNHRSLTETDPITPGEFRDLHFTLQPTDQVIPAGRQIGLMIFSSDREFTLWPEPGTELTFELDGIRLDLPIVGGGR